MLLIGVPLCIKSAQTCLRPIKLVHRVVVNIEPVKLHHARNQWATSLHEVRETSATISGAHVAVHAGAPFPPLS